MSRLFADARRMRMLGRRVSVPAALLALGLAAPAGAGADVFGPISLLSATPFVQADYAHDPAISADGRYVVFDGSIGGVTGVWRREIGAGGTAVQVAGGDAELPSISADGRYVSFTTNQGGRLAELSDGVAHAEGVHETPGVYVRDMELQPGQGGAFTLASAVNGSMQSLTYEYHGGEAEQREREEFGSLAAGRSALSADGRKVVFVTTATSNLAGPGTPPLQVAVRDLDTDATQLVSVRYDAATGLPAVDPETGRDEPVPSVSEGASAYGAVYAAGGSPPQFTTPQAYEAEHEVNASISADGTTVAWLAQDIPEQAPTLSAETLPARYDEPLWRRIADGEQAPVRRVTGGSDPTSPECVAHPEAKLPLTPSPADPCQGPFVAELGTWNAKASAVVTPSLSADGYEVAFIASAEPVALAGGFGRGGIERESDVYVADMHQGLTRTQALRALTELGSGSEEDVASNAEIVDVSISPDAGQVAFTTRRTQFPLSAPAYVSAPAPVPGLLELFDVDLLDNTLTRVTHGYEGGPGAHPHGESVDEDPYQFKTDGGLSPSFSQDGDLLAFSSTASNLVYGDGNTPPLNTHQGAQDGGDVFVVPREVFAADPTPQFVSGAPPNPTLSPLWTLGVTSASLRNGDVVLYLALPGAGRVQAGASARLTVRVRASRGRRAHPRSLLRTLASAAKSATFQEGVPVALTLPLAGAYRSLAERSQGIVASATITFSAPGHPLLRRTVAVRFRRVRSTHASASSRRKGTTRKQGAQAR